MLSPPEDLSGEDRSETSVMLNLLSPLVSVQCTEACASPDHATSMKD